MSIVGILLILLIFAAGFYLISRYVPTGNLRTFLLVALAIVVFIWIASVTGVWGSLARTPR